VSVSGMDRLSGENITGNGNVMALWGD